MKSKQSWPKGYVDIEKEIERIDLLNSEMERTVLETKSFISEWELFLVDVKELSQRIQEFYSLRGSSYSLFASLTEETRKMIKRYSEEIPLLSNKDERTHLNLLLSQLRATISMKEVDEYIAYSKEKSRIKRQLNDDRNFLRNEIEEVKRRASSNLLLRDPNLTLEVIKGNSEFDGCLSNVDKVNSEDAINTVIKDTIYWGSFLQLSKAIETMDDSLIKDLVVLMKREFPEEERPLFLTHDYVWSLEDMPPVPSIGIPGRGVGYRR